MASQMMEVSDDALKLMVAEHGVRGTARLLQMDETQMNTFRKRVTRAGWMQDPAIASVRALSSPTSVASPVVSRLSPIQANAAELQRLGSETRLSLAKGIAKAGEHVETMDGQEILIDAQNIKSIAQTADLVHGWKDSAPQVKIRLDILGGGAEPMHDVTQDVEAEAIADWPDVDPLDEY